MKAHIQRWLGLDDLRSEIEFLADNQKAQARIISKSLDNLEQQARPLLVALARMIAQKDKYFAMDELDPRRKAESDVIGEQVIQRLQAEDAVRRRT